ncbi:DUF1254 domain-containing protein [Sandaracinus amylolyticus]|uniref:DUF1254 domain-containing protein n=1 Tax=Sandaracinus amylolyticus TaxID=927083 RepID=A0A0F6WA07_9BACT|nr:DUF1254 domain-containing protein [Sandaracinus amylolyticus]AKF11250.1 hypothetical protein DB32_008399 [Sandaracinus amylolyticus]
MDPHTARPELEHEYPTSDGARSVYDDQDLQRAVQAYRFFYPTVSMEAIFHGNRQAGVEDGKAIMMLAAGPRHVGFTVNSDTPYAACVLDLQSMGPTVIDLPPGPYVGMVDDHDHRWIGDIGIPGPDRGEGGRYLLLPLDYAGEIPRDHLVARSPTRRALLGLRAIPGESGTEGAMEALRRVKIHPYARPDAPLGVIDVSDRDIDTSPLRWENELEYWRRLHAVLEQEPPREEFRPMYGLLAALGIERGRPFAPDRRMKRILELATEVGLDQMRVEGFAAGRPDLLVWPDRRWEWIGLTADPDFESGSHLDLQARDRWFVQAIGASPAMFRRAPGGGSIYFLGARDDSGEYLDGGHTYELRVPLPVPAQLFWSVTAYDSKTRSQVRAPQDRAVLSSLQRTFEPGPDGFARLHFGPTAPPGGERAWIQTTPDTGFFLYMRIYGPEPAAFDGSWKPGDPTRIDRAPARARTISPATLRSISTPDSIESAIGTLRFHDGIPRTETAARLYDHLDSVHAQNAYLNGLQAVSTYAIRQGLFDVGVRDNDVLVFSRLMDSQSLFLTANCDTVYFISMLDVSAGPLVLELPARTLGVIDDMWFRWVGDVGTSGPDRGEGGRYLIVPERYAGPLPEGGFYVLRSKTDHLLLLGRAFLEDDDPAPAAARIRRDLKIQPYVAGTIGSSIGAYLRSEGPLGALAAPARPTRFVEGTGLVMSTIPPNDESFFEMLDAVVQLEPAEALDPEIAGHAAAIGIVKGRRFRPDKRLQRILSEAIVIANATARTIAVRPRASEGFGYYGEGSAWSNPLFVGGYEFLRPPPRITSDGVEQLPSSGARALASRTQMFYLATGITPAMCMRLENVGSQYLGAFYDADGDPFDGASTYELTLPPGIPAGLFWSLTLYDNQTRSMLQTPQRFPRAGSQAYPTPAAVAREDGSITVFFAPERPHGVPEGNWIQTVPGKGWFVLLRLYSPLRAFFDKTWRPGEIRHTTPRVSA